MCMLFGTFDTDVLMIDHGLARINMDDTETQCFWNTPSTCSMLVEIWIYGDPETPLGVKCWWQDRLNKVVHRICIIVRHWKIDIEMS